jgi:choline dehydrogenase-like flavoprotein
MHNKPAVKRAIVVGTGAGGATVAKELQGAFDVTVLEAGKEFNRLQMTLPAMETLKRAHLLFDRREIQLIFPHLHVRAAADDLLLVNGVGLGGTTTVCTGNALRMDKDIRALGIDLDIEFEEVYREIPITTSHQVGWHPTTRRLFEICREMGLDPQPTPKMGDYERCHHCGRCVFGCPYGVKWDSRQFLQLAVEHGARVVTGCHVTRIVVQHGRATGVEVRQGWRRALYPADLIVIAAGGLGTPAILERSGIPCEPYLFVDPVLWVAGRAPGCAQCYEVEMPFVIQREGFILSPYFDFLSFFFNRASRYPAVDTLGMMIKLADANEGRVTGRNVDKSLTDDDRKRLTQAAALCEEVLDQFGIDDGTLFLGTLNGGHPGGTLPLDASTAISFHDTRLPENVYVADASLIPRALGNPPILTIVALAKRVSRQCIATCA